MLWENLRKRHPADKAAAMLREARQQRRLHSASASGEMKRRAIEEAAKEVQSAQSLCRRVTDVLRQYGQEGARGATRSFGFIQDARLREIVTRDYQEVSLNAFPGGAWKSTIVMAGSILEAILIDHLDRTGVREGARAFIKSQLKPGPGKKAPKVPSSVRMWGLELLIKAAGHLKLLPQDNAIYDCVLRDLRNLIHPAKEGGDRRCDESRAGQVKYTLDVVCEHFQQRYEAAVTSGVSSAP
jgi:hypothetical protein